MGLYVQYHNIEKRGLEGLLADNDRYGIATGRREAKHAQGTIFIIVGVGRPRHFFLWIAFEVQGFKEHADGTFVASGSGWRLSPPQQLEGPDFKRFKNTCANFITFRNISDQPYSAKLMTLAETYRSQTSDEMMHAFWIRFLRLLKKRSDDHFRVLQLLGGHSVGEEPPS